MKLAKSFELLRQPRDLRLLLKMLLFAASLPILLRVFSFRRFLSLITPYGTTPKQAPQSQEKIVRYGVSLLKRNKLFLQNTCLKRSLLLYHFLRKNGVEVRIHFGAKQSDSYLAGHSWLTQEGALLADVGRHVEAFTEVLSFPPHKIITKPQKNFFSSSRAPGCGYH